MVKELEKEPQFSQQLSQNISVLKSLNQLETQLWITRKRLSIQECLLWLSKVMMSLTNSLVSPLQSLKVGFYLIFTKFSCQKMIKRNSKTPKDDHFEFLFNVYISCILILYYILIFLLFTLIYIFLIFEIIVK